MMATFLRLGCLGRLAGRTFAPGLGLLLVGLAISAGAQAQTGLRAPDAMAAGRAAPADDPAKSERLTVADPFIEIHTGPGRGYPVFFVVPRGEAIVVTMRRTDWYRVRTPEGLSLIHI